MAMQAQPGRSVVPAPATEYVFPILRQTGLVLLLLIFLGSTGALCGQTSRQSVPAGSGRTPLAVLNGSARLLSRYEADKKLRVTIGIRAPKLAEEEKLLAQLQDPGSPNFHKYLTAAQWNDRFAPAAEDEQAVVDWLTASGLTITHRFSHRLIVDAEAPVAVIEKAFAVQINHYQVDENTEFSNDRDPVIPAHLENIVLMVGGLNSIQRLRSAHEGNFHQTRPDYSPGPVYQEGIHYQHDGDSAALQAALQAREDMTASTHYISASDPESGPQPQLTASGLIEPTDVYGSYGYDFGPLQHLGHCCNPTSDPGGPTPTTSIAIATAGQFALSDLQGFIAAFPYLSADVTTVNIDGTPTCCNDESTLDVEWATATSNSLGVYLNTAHIWVYEATTDTSEELANDFSFMLEDGHARVATISWGCGETYCFNPLEQGADHQIYDAMLGQGWTLIAASGDHGSAGNCDDGVEVVRPASDPDFIAVGGTTLSLYSDGRFSGETAWTGNTAAGSCSTNHGGSTGGCSSQYSAPGYQSKPYCGAGSRSVPDISLNANSGQAYFFGGQLSVAAGTSIAAPEVAGFMAQENSYLLAMGNGCGTNHSASCAPVGEANYAIYKQGYASAANQKYAPHDPFYDITSGCNSNDVTALYELQIFCAGPGYDAVTGWGTFNALQLAWEMNWYYEADFGAPKVSYQGPLANPNTGARTWFNSDQTVSWTVADTSNGSLPSVGVAGFSQAWDTPFEDPNKEAHQGSGNSFYNGPQIAATTGSLDLLSAGQGCHTAYVEAWDNTGLGSGNTPYGILCLDTVPPVVTASNSATPNAAGWFNAPVQVTLTTTDPGGSKASGVANTYFGYGSTNCAPGALSTCSQYTGIPLIFNEDGVDGFIYFAQDNANNFSPIALGVIHLDTTPPITQATPVGTQSTNGVFISNVKVSLSATDNVSGVASTSYVLDSGAQMNYTGPIPVSGLGTHTLRFSSVDVAGNSESVHVLTIIIAQASTTSLSASPNPAVSGQTITLTASVLVAGVAPSSGTVEFLSGTALLGSANVSGGLATLTVTSLTTGDNLLTAVYSGSTNILGSTSAVVHEDFQLPTVTTLTTSVNPSAVAQPVMLTAKVVPNGTNGAAITGWVTFYSGSTQLAFVALQNGVAACTVSTLPVGNNPISAQYAGDVDFAPSNSSATTQTVTEGTTVTKLISLHDPSQYLQTASFAANVSSAYGTPTGTVTFANNNVVIGKGILSNGIATFTTSSLGVGNHNITAAFTGSGSYTRSISGVLTQTVGPAESQVYMSSSLNPASYGQPIQLAVTVSNPNGGLPSGTVELMDGTTQITSATVTNGSATLIFRGSTLFAYPAAGTHSLTAIYAGSTDYLAGTSPVVIETVNPAATSTGLTSSLNPSTTLSSVTFTATVTAATGLSPGGSVTFHDGRTTLGTGTVSTSGVATFTASKLTAGTHNIFAVYGGTANYSPSTSTVLEQVVKPINF